jgi:ABC-type branched-subunit amino acid transport system permease subunit
MALSLIGMFAGAFLALVMSLSGSPLFSAARALFRHRHHWPGRSPRLLTLHFRWTNGAIGLTIPLKGDALAYQFTSKIPLFYCLGILVVDLYASGGWRIAPRELSSGHRPDQDAAEAVGIDSAKAKRQALY